MQTLPRAQFLKLVDLSGNAFDQQIFKGNSVLTFGSPTPATANTFLPTDALHVLAMTELARGIGQSESAALLRFSPHVVLDAIVRAEYDPQPIWLCVMVRGDQRGERYDLAGGTFADLATDLAQEPPPARILLVNVTDLVGRVRRNAKAAGIELRSPLLLRPDDRRYEALIRELEAIAVGRLDRARKAAFAELTKLRQRITAELVQ